MLDNANPIICGIDYGSKLAGTTVLATGELDSKIVSFDEAKPRQDADLFLFQKIVALQPRVVFLDAPLSLPGVYRQLPGYEDYFYRKADVSVQAMSPMFLGGLTARAMRLKRKLESNNIYVFETYPSAQAQRLQLKELGYKKSVKDIERVLAKIRILFREWQLFHPLTSWHQVDALLALMGAYRFVQGIHTCAGDETEGLIYV